MKAKKIAVAIFIVLFALTLCAGIWMARILYGYEKGFKETGTYVCPDGPTSFASLIIYLAVRSEEDKFYLTCNADAMYEGSHQATADPNAYLLDVEKETLREGETADETANQETLDGSVLIIKRGKAYLDIEGSGMIEFEKQDAYGTAVYVSTPES